MQKGFLRSNAHEVSCSSWAHLGSGKTTLAAHFAREFKRDKKWKDKNIYCNVPIKHTLMLNPADDFGTYLVEDGVVIVDESGIEFNNRAFKTLPKQVIQFAKYYRHYGIKSFVMLSQGLDVDITFQRLADAIFIVRRSYLPYFVCVKQAIKFIGIDETTGQLVDKYEWKRGGKHLVFMPPCWKWFDTYETPPLKEREWKEWDYLSRWLSPLEEVEKEKASVSNDEAMEIIQLNIMHRDAARLLSSYM